MRVIGHHRAFGLRLRADFPLPELRPEPPGPHDVELVLADRAVVAEVFSGPVDPPASHLAALGDGTLYRVERGVDGDVRIDADRRGSFHLSPGARLVRCTAGTPPAQEHVEDPDWRRFLLDTVLGTAALVHGREALHAGACLTSAGVLAIVAAEGGGKSTLLAEHLRRGSQFFTDDILVIDPEGRAYPGPPVMNVAPVLPDGTPASAIGDVIATIGGECWLAVRHPADAPATVAAVILLDRGPHQALHVERLAPSPVPLLRHSLSTGSTPARLGERFRLCADLAATVPLLSVTSPAGCPAADVADAVDDTLERVLDDHDRPAVRG